ncbi:MAG: DUF3883 domain-containing protein [Acidobacteriota bacterium]
MKEQVDLVAPAKSHLPVVVYGLVQSGWKIVGAPGSGKLRRNGQFIVLKTAARDIRIRLFMYKVTGSSRGRPNERRIEITSTYQKGSISRSNEYQDIVLGFDPEKKIFVGVDARRIEEGGPTGNASSFFDSEGLAWSRSDEILVQPHAAKLFQKGIEFHAFFKAQCLAEYLFHAEAIHNGSYLASKLTNARGSVGAVPASLSIERALAFGDRLVLQGSAPARTKLSGSSGLVKAYESGNDAQLRRRKISQKTLMEIKLRCEENGRLGEEFVLDAERRRLRKAGKPKLAEEVKLISPDSACEGYDILSYEVNGSKRLVEVKSTSGEHYVFEMSDNEWRTAKRWKDQYFIYRVTDVRKKPKHKSFRNPIELEKQGLLTKTTSGWRITLK